MGPNEIYKLLHSKWNHVCLVTQLYPTLCDPMDCSPPGSSVHGDYPDKNTGVGCHALHQGIFLIQGLNPGPLHCRLILYHLSHQLLHSKQNHKQHEKTTYGLGKKIFANDETDKGLNIQTIFVYFQNLYISKIYKQLIQLNNKKTT